MSNGRRLPGIVRTTFVAVVLGCVALSGCKTETDAGAAAKQLDKTATSLAAYYDDLSTQLDETVTLNEVQGVMDKIPFGPTDRAPILDVKSEIGKRAAMAHALSELAEAYGDLAGSKAGGDASTAASALATDLSSVKALPSGKGIPDMCGDAAKMLVEFAQTHDLKKGSEGVSKAVGAVSEIFEREKPAYESIEKQRLALARQIAVKMVDNHEINVDYNELVAPATKPFHLTPKGKDVSGDAAYGELMKTEIDAQVQEQERDFADATDHLGASLKSVKEAVEKVGSGKWYGRG